MESKDLMIGDWVNYHGIFNKIAPADFCHKEWLEEIQPIPLTPEVLEKNGFTEDGKCHWTLSDEYTGDDVIGLYEVANGFAMLTSDLTIGLQSVHELQHLFRLCGITREIII